MCGIFGYVGSDQDAAAVVLRALKKLEYRGYDSWGVAVASDGGAFLERRVGKIGEAVAALPASPIGLGHTRWATHGGVTQPNAHPHLDCAGRLALVHNGIVTNYRELRAGLIQAGHRFGSETDTEVVVHLLEDCLSQTLAGPDQLAVATIAAFRQLEGLNAIAVLDVDSGQLAAAKSGSPLVLGWGEHGNMYPDYMTKEIHEQPAMLRQIADSWRHHACRLAARLRDADDIFLVGCGTAGHAALAAQYLFARIAGRRVTFATGSEFPYLRDFVGENALVVALSQSGETIDVIDSVKAARERGARVAAMVNVEGSTLWRMADERVPLGAGPERCVLATKSFSAKLAILLMTAYELTGKIDVGEALVRQTADEIERLLTDHRHDLIRGIAEDIYGRDHLFVIGRGPSYPLALEAALKVKEASYVHAEGFAGGELKHGVIALIEPGTPCLVLAPRDETYADIMSGAMEVKARGALLIGVSPEPDEAFDHHIPIADVGPATAMLSAVPAQLLGYYLALRRGHDPDKPRNLAKSVTVK